MAADHSLRIEWPGGNGRAELLAGSLAPAARDLRNDRSSTSIQVDADRLLIEIEANDLIALRAAANTWLGLLRTAESARSLAEA